MPRISPNTPRLLPSPSGASSTATPHRVRAAGTPYVQLQEELSRARMALGRAELAHGHVRALRARVQQLEAQERAQLAGAPEQVERARLPVFLERFRALEAARGTTGAVELARSVYYTGPAWAGASGVRPLDTAERDALGLPQSQEANGGFHNPGHNGPMRLPDGRLFNMGTLLCGLEWTLRAGHLPRLDSAPDLPLPLPNPLRSPAAVTLAGDLGQAVEKQAQGRMSGFDAVLTQNNYDLRGGVLGLVLARRLTSLRRQGTGALAADVLEQFLLHPPGPAATLDELARGYPQWFHRSGSPQAPRYHVRSAFRRSVYLSALASSLGHTALKGIRSSGRVAAGFSEWMDLEARGQAPLGNYPGASPDPEGGTATKKKGAP